MRFRSRRLLLAFSALAVAATLATALFSVYSDIERKMRGRVPRLRRQPDHRAGGDSPHTVPLRGVDGSRAAWAPPPRRSSTLWAAFSDEPVVVAGVDFRRAAPLTAYWRVEGARAAAAGECLAGRAPRPRISS